MPYSKELHNSLNHVSAQHIILTEKFNEFAKFVKNCVDNPSIANKNIVLSLQNLDKGIISTAFAGRTTTFVFNTILKDDGNLEGSVRCFILHDFPEPKQIRLGEFAFNLEGVTNLSLPNEDSKITMNSDFGTLHIVLHFIREGLRYFNSFRH